MWFVFFYVFSKLNKPMKYTFLMKTLLHLGFQLTLTGITMERLNSSMKNYALNQKPIWFFLFLFVAFMLTILISNESIPAPVRFGLFCVFSILKGLLIATLFKDRNVSSDSVKKAVFETLGIFTLMSVVGILLLQSGVSIAPLMFATILFNITLIFVLIYILFNKVDDEKIRIFRLAVILLMMLYIIIHTHNNLNTRVKNDLMISTLNYYINVISIFRNLVLLSDD